MWRNWKILIRVQWSQLQFGNNKFGKWAQHERISDIHYLLRKAIKATLLLVPLLGVSNLLLFLEPNPQNQQLHKVYMVFATILQNSQVFFLWQTTEDYCLKNIFRECLLPSFIVFATQKFKKHFTGDWKNGLYIIVIGKSRLLWKYFYIIFD